MVDGPFRERRVSAKDARAILRRAIELDAQGDGEPLAVAEIARLASSFGISADAVARAAQDPTASGGQRDGDGKPSRSYFGVPQRVFFEESVPLEIDDRAVEDLVAAVQAEIGTRGTVQVLGGTTTWLVAPRKGDGRAITVDVRRRDGQTLVRIEEQTGILLYELVAVGLGLFFVAALAVAAAGAALTAVAFCLLLPFVFMAAVAWFRKKADQRTQQLRRLATKLRSLCEQSRRPEVRIGAELGARIVDDEELLASDDEAERCLTR